VGHHESGAGIAAVGDRRGRADGGLPLNEVQQGATAKAMITSHEAWGLTARLNEYEPVGASLDTIRHRSEPGVKRLVRGLQPARWVWDLNPR
jgi:hypothetical protein